MASAGQPQRLPDPSLAVSDSLERQEPETQVHLLARALQSVNDCVSITDHYAPGGHASRFRSRAVSGFKLSAGERADLLAFLNRLTDEAFLADPAFAAPH